MYTAIPKKKAMRLVKLGTPVFAAASKINPAGLMGVITVSASLEGKSAWHQFEKEFKWYNCNTECGTGVSYYTRG
jgi:hypothetical protein